MNVIYILIRVQVAFSGDSVHLESGFTKILHSKEMALTFVLESRLAKKYLHQRNLYLFQKFPILHFRPSQSSLAFKSLACESLVFYRAVVPFFCRILKKIIIVADFFTTGRIIFFQQKHCHKLVENVN